MGLVDLRTDLKSIKFGKDLVGGGNSNQPYIVKDIPSSFQDVGRTGGPDFLLRGGTLFPKAIVNDVSRMTQMLFDFRSPNGPLFIAKQNALSLSNVNTNTGYIKYKNEPDNTPSGDPLSAIGQFIADNLALNQGIYTPLSTIASVIGTGVGVHPNKQGLNPFNPMLGGEPGDVQTQPKGLTLPTYIEITDGGPDGKRSRLLGFLPKINSKQGDNILYKYTGGPGSTLGVGTTTINMLNDQRTGINQEGNTGTITFLPNTIQLTGSFTDLFPLPPLAKAAQSALNIGSNPSLTSLTQFIDKNVINLSGSFNPLDSLFGVRSVYNNNVTNQSGSAAPVYFSPNNLILSGSTSGVSLGFAAFNQQQIENYYNIQNQERTATGIKPDFRKTLINDSPIIPASPDYVTKNIEQRVNLGNPSARGNIKSYTAGKIIPGNNKSEPLDKLNALPLYNSANVISSNSNDGFGIKNDLVKFRIGIINNDDPNNKTYIHFRAFIDSMSDSYSADWMTQKFMGRAENYYKYQGFDRTVSLAWTVAAQSKNELIPMYQKLNYLASSLAPDYSDAGYMQGNLITLTMGGWFYEQPGLITGMSLDVPDDSPWDISINDEGGSDPTVKELPMIIKVSGFNFVPIHDFVPRIQQNSFKQTDYLGADGNFISNYGKERYISLNNGRNNNYDKNNYVPQKPQDTT